MNTIKRAVVIGDNQIPFHDPLATDLFFKFLGDYKPDVIILNGDVIDFYKLSHYTRSPLHKFSLMDEIHQTQQFLLQLRQLCPNAEITWIEGNHEFRLKSSLLHIPDEDLKAFLLQHGSLQMESLFELDALRIKYVGLPDHFAKWSDCYTEYEGFLIGHFNKVNQHAGYTARAIGDKYGKSIIQNHTHRVGSNIKREFHGLVKSYEIGSLCSLRPSYMTFPDWCQGWGIIETHEGVSSFYQIVLEDYKFVYNNRIYAS